MTQLNHYLYPREESHVSLICNGETLQAEGLSPNTNHIPQLYQRGCLAIYHLLESHLPFLSCISIKGIWFSQEMESPFVAFSIWVQQEKEGFYLPFATSASLLQANGIPYSTSLFRLRTDRMAGQRSWQAF